MYLSFSADFSHHQMGEHATRPIACLPSRLALLLLVAGLALRPRRVPDRVEDRL
jgi:hypothetical protein